MIRNITTAKLLNFIAWCSCEIIQKTGVPGQEQHVRELIEAKRHARQSIAFVKLVTTPDPDIDV